ncbi:hypothetical protein PG997_008024 [Apiospora hydei]|uniref:Uncharacterized protein n=1 Tax=Apiospora hydei TaxID=1337664 RepID=A0ABR1W9Q6_9PEZI
MMETLSTNGVCKRKQGSKELTDDEFDSEPEPEPGDIHLLNRDGDGERHEPEYSRQKKLLSHADSSPPENPDRERRD